jgi:hypothetical protein
MIPDIADLQERLVGHAFPGGTFVVEGYERWLSHDAMQAPTLPDGVLHPAWIVLGALRGMGLTIDELIELAGATPQDGVVFGETDFEQHAPLASDREYRVRGGVTAVTRRQGKRVGTFDVLAFELVIEDARGATAAVSRQSFIVLREQGAR